MTKDEYKRVYYERNPEVKLGDGMFAKKMSTVRYIKNTTAIPCYGWEHCV